MEMYELCVFFKNYEKAKVKLVEFQKSLETVGWNWGALLSSLKLAGTAFVLVAGMGGSRRVIVPHD